MLARPTSEMTLAIFCRIIAKRVYGGMDRVRRVENAVTLLVWPLLHELGKSAGYILNTRKSSTLSHLFFSFSTLCRQSSRRLNIRFFFLEVALALPLLLIVRSSLVLSAFAIVRSQHDPRNHLHSCVLWPSRSSTKSPNLHHGALRSHSPVCACVFRLGSRVSPRQAG